MRVGEIKKRAKLALIGKYWWSILASLILGFVSSGFVFNSFLPNIFRSSKGNYEGLQQFLDLKISSLPIENMLPVATIALILIIAVILLLLFVVAVAVILSLMRSSVRVGYSKFNMALFTDEEKRPSLDYLFSYVKGSMWKCLWLDILIDLKVILWFLPSVVFGFGAWFFFFEKPVSFVYQDYDVCYMAIIFALLALTFIILSIIASIRYSQALYIMAEDPENNTASEAVEKSKELMKGNKFKYFWLVLSFFGWFIVAVLTCGLGFFFLAPYFEASLAAFHLDKIKNFEALDLGSADQINA